VPPKNSRVEAIKVRVELKAACGVDVGPNSTEPRARSGFKNDNLEVVGYAMSTREMSSTRIIIKIHNERCRRYTGQSYRGVNRYIRWKEKKSTCSDNSNSPVWITRLVRTFRRWGFE
jgi:hypothetical protein